MFVSNWQEAIPENLSSFGHTDVVSSQLVLVELKFELLWIETSPINHRPILYPRF